MQTSSPPPSDALVIFGITGDLAYKKIFPALASLERRGRLPEFLVGVARGGTGREALVERMRASLVEHGAPAGLVAQGQQVGAHGLIALDWRSGNRSILVDHELSGVMGGQTLQPRPAYR